MGEKLATCLSRCKELKSAFVECEKCLKLCPNHVEAIFRFASILSNLKKYKKAERFFEKCLEKSNQKHGKCWNNFGVMRLNVGKYEEAMHFFKKAQYILKNSASALREVQKNIDLCSRKKMESLQQDEDGTASKVGHLDQVPHVNAKPVAQPRMATIEEQPAEKKKENNTNGKKSNGRHGKKGKNNKGKKAKR